MIKHNVYICVYVIQFYQISPSFQLIPKKFPRWSTHGTFLEMFRPFATLILAMFLTYFVYILIGHSDISN